MFLSFFPQRMEEGDTDWDLNVGENLELWSDFKTSRVSGSHLPRHSDAQTCCITNTIIKVRFLTFFSSFVLSSVIWRVLFMVICPLCCL